MQFCYQETSSIRTILLGIKVFELTSLRCNRQWGIISSPVWKLMRIFASKLSSWQRWQRYMYNMNETILTKRPYIHVYIVSAKYVRNHLEITYLTVRNWIFENHLCRQVSFLRIIALIKHQSHPTLVITRWFVSVTLQVQNIHVHVLRWYSIQRQVHNVRSIIFIEAHQLQICMALSIIFMESHNNYYRYDIIRNIWLNLIGGDYEVKQPAAACKVQCEREAI